MSGFSRFAAAFGLAPKASPVVAEDPKKDETKEEKESRRAKERARKAGETDEDYAKRSAELDEKEKAEDDKKKPGDKDDNEGTKGDKDEEEKCAAARAAGIKAERARWSATLADPRAKGRGVYACQLLDTTDMGSEPILATIATFPEQGAIAASEMNGLALRMEAVTALNPAPAPGGGAGGPAAGTPEHTASLITKAAALARGEK